MGDPRRQRSQVRTPNHPWEKARMKEELEFLGEYGLRNKREFWKHRTQLRTYRALARQLRTMPPEVRDKGIREITGKLIRFGILSPGEHSFDDVLNLSIRDFLDRRLQTIVLKKGLAKSQAQARQLITHRHIAVGGQVIDSPSYLVDTKFDTDIGYALRSAYANADHPIHQALAQSKAAPARVEEEGGEERGRRPPARGRKPRSRRKPEAEEGAVEAPAAPKGDSEEE